MSPFSSVCIQRPESPDLSPLWPTASPLVSLSLTLANMGFNPITTAPATDPLTNSYCKNFCTCSSCQTSPDLFMFMPGLFLYLSDLCLLFRQCLLFCIRSRFFCVFIFLTVLLSVSVPSCIPVALPHSSYSCSVSVVFPPCLPSFHSPPLASVLSGFLLSRNDLWDWTHRTVGVKTG